MRKADEGTEGLTAEPEDHEFDPFGWARTGESIEFMQSLGDLIFDCVRQAEQIIATNKDNRELQNQALDLANLAVATITAGAASTESYPEANWEGMRKSLVLMYLTGIESVRLAIATRRADISIDEAIDQVKSMVLRDAGKKAAKAKHKATNESKAAAVAEWEEEGYRYSGMAAFARYRCKAYGVTDRTLQKWISDSQKNK